MTCKGSLRHGFARSWTRRPYHADESQKGRNSCPGDARENDLSWVISVLIIGEVIQAASRQVSSIIRSKLVQNKEICLQSIVIQIDTTEILYYGKSLLQTASSFFNFAHSFLPLYLVYLLCWLQNLLIIHREKTERN